MMTMAVMLVLIYVICNVDVHVDVDIAYGDEGSQPYYIRVTGCKGGTLPIGCPTGLAVSPGTNEYCILCISVINRYRFSQHDKSTKCNRLQ